MIIIIGSSIIISVRHTVNAKHWCLCQSESRPNNKQTLGTHWSIKQLTQQSSGNPKARTAVNRRSYLFLAWNGTPSPGCLLSTMKIIALQPGYVRNPSKFYSLSGYSVTGRINQTRRLPTLQSECAPQMQPSSFDRSYLGVLHSNNGTERTHRTPALTHPFGRHCLA